MTHECRSTHTPGNWHLTDRVHDHKDGQVWVVTVFADTDVEWGKITAEAIAPTREMATANAALIAAAPDLLAALTGVIDSLETADKEWQIAAFERAEAAIRKATERE